MSEYQKRVSRYKVFACSNSKLRPGRVHVGSYNSASHAVASAHRVIRHSLELLHHKNSQCTADELFRLYLCHGHVPGIFGEAAILFDGDGALAWATKRIMRRTSAGAGSGLMECPAARLPLAALILRQLLEDRE